MTIALVRTRYATGHDVPGLVDLHRRCSPATLHSRFHVPVSAVSARLVEQLVAPTRGWSLVAEQHGAPVGLGCAGPVAAGVVEVGLLVEDAHQGTGIGTRLTRDLALEATRRGFHTLVCLALPGNITIVPTLRRAGLEAGARRRDGLLEVVAALPARRGSLRHPA